MKQVYDVTGFKSCKLMHRRTQMVQQAGSKDLVPYYKEAHMLEKMHFAYQLEHGKETLNVMGGQGMGESQFFEREYLNTTGYAFTVMKYTCLLLPDYDTWVNKSQPDIGNLSLCLVPSSFLTLFHNWLRSLFKMEYFFIIDFPNHPILQFPKVVIVSNSSSLFQNQILGYKQWEATTKTQTKWLH
jgi:hypothetical protein